MGLSVKVQPYKFAKNWKNVARPTGASTTDYTYLKCALVLKKFLPKIFNTFFEQVRKLCIERHDFPKISPDVIQEPSKFLRNWTLSQKLVQQPKNF